MDDRERPARALFAEVARKIEAVNLRKHGRIDPGNSFCGWLTIEPREAEKIDESNRREMNPITYCVTLRGREGEGNIPVPEGYAG